MANLYIIVMKHHAGEFALTSTAAKSPKEAWDQAVERYGRHCKATDRTEIIKELKRKEGWRVRRVETPFNVA